MKSTPHTPQTPTPPAQAGIYRLAAAGLVDPCAPVNHPSPQDLLVELSQAAADSTRRIRVLAADTPAQVDTHPAAARATTLDLRHAVLMPGMVNAHTHLDLTHLGPLAHDPDEGFVHWVDRVRAGRAQEPEDIRASVERGIELSLRAGVFAVGDIAGAPLGQPRIEPFQALADSPLRAISYIEFFAMGSAETPSLERLEAFLAHAPPPRAGTRLGLQPHATNTVSLNAYRRAIRLAREQDLPLATHLAETPEEREFIAHATGPQRELLERFGFWQPDILEHLGKGKSPIAHLAPALSQAPFLVAHVNDTGPDPDAAIDTLARTNTTVAYCPRASTYFNAPAHFGPHQHQAMLAAGINVCLGTDSIINLPEGADAPAGPGLSVLDEARLLYARDAADPITLIRMITTHGCLALSLPESLCNLSQNATPAALVAIAVGNQPDTRTPDTRTPAARLLGSTSQATLLAIAPPE